MTYAHPSFNLGFLHESQGEYDTALDYYYKALLLLEQHRLESKANALNNIGQIYRIKKNFQEAIKFFEKGLIEAKQDQSKYLLSIINMNLGALYLEIKNFRKARTYLIRSIKLSRLSNNLATEALALFNLATLYCDNKARYYYQKAYELWIHLEDNQNAARALAKIQN